MLLTPESRLVSRSFGAGEELYTDPYGRRVVCDVEGSGSFVASPGVAVFADGQQVGQEGKFASHVLGVAEPGQVARGSVLCGTAPSLTHGTCTTRLEGCGWVVSSKGPIRVLGEGETVPQVASLPLPILFGAECEHGMCAVRSRQQIVLVDAFDVSDPVALKGRGWSVQNGSELCDLASSLPDGTPLQRRHMSHLNTASWDCGIPANNDGLIVRRLYDRFHGRQRARVLIDGTPAGVWYDADQRRALRWAWSRFGVPAELTSGRARVRIAIDPSAGVPLWDVSKIEVYVLICQ